MPSLADFSARRALTPLLAAVLSLSAALHAQPALPQLAPADGLGVNIHFTDPPPGEMKMIAAAGFKWVRMDLTWSETERAKGLYDFSAYDRLLAALDREKMHALLILDYGNPLYGDPHEQQPFTDRAGMDEFRAAFARWAGAAARHFAGRGCIWEMWNEPNGTNFWAPAPDVGEYIALAKATAAAMRQAAPGEPLIGPATSGIDFNFIEACFQAGLLSDWAAVSVHPYRQSDPGAVSADYRRLREMIAKYAPPGKAIPIISSEWGYSTAWKNLDEAKQAQYLASEFSINIASGIPLSIWYDWRDDGDDSANAEHRFGMVRRPYHAGRDPVFDPKPAYTAMKAIAALLARPAASPAP
jgi:hypothetical protein